MPDENSDRIHKIYSEIPTAALFGWLQPKTSETSFVITIWSCNSADDLGRNEYERILECCRKYFTIEWSTLRNPTLSYISTQDCAPCYTSENKTQMPARWLHFNFSLERQFPGFESHGKLLSTEPKLLNANNTVDISEETIKGIREKDSEVQET